MSLNITLYKSFKRKIDLYLSVKQYEPSVELLENKLSLHPGDVRLTKLLALIYFFQDKKDKTFSLLERCKKNYPEEKEIKLILLALHCELGEYKKARICYEELKSESLDLLGKTLSTQRLAEDFISCGLTFYRSNNFSRAVVQFSQALTLCPESSEAVVCLAKAQVKLKDYEKAGRVLKDFCKNHTPSSDVYLWLGLIYYEFSRFQLANFHLTKARELNPENRLADVYLKYLQFPTAKDIDLDGSK